MQHSFTENFIHVYGNYNWDHKSSKMHHLLIALLLTDQRQMLKYRLIISPNLHTVNAMGQDVTVPEVN